MIYALLIIIIVILIGIIINQNRKILYISKTIKEIMLGNFNERVRLQNHNKAVSKLVSNLNKLIDEFQKVLNLNKNYEEDRKKMISNISHDLRTPLTSLLGYVEFIKDPNVSEAEKKEYIDIIEKKGNSLKVLMEEFFQLSKIESNDLNLEIKRVNLSEIIRQNIILFYNDFIQQGIEPVFNIPEKDIYALGDEGAINRILNNLVSNSLKYGLDGKVIGIDLRQDKDKVYIDVWDKGKGIPKEDIDFVFERLYTAEKSRNRKLQGSGIGLTIVKKLVEKQKGEIKLTSTPYEKTTFSFSIPVDTEHLRNS